MRKVIAGFGASTMIIGGAVCYGLWAQLNWAHIAQTLLYTMLNDPWSKLIEFAGLLFLLFMVARLLLPKEPLE